MKKALVANTTTIAFTFKDDVPSVIFDYAKASEANRDYAEVHGWLARIGDTAASSKTEAERAAAIKTLVDHYESGAVGWNLTGGTRAAPQNPTILAIAAKLGCTYVEAEAEIQRRMLAELSE